MELLLKQSQALEGTESPRPASPYHLNFLLKSLGFHRSGKQARASMEKLQIEDLNMKLVGRKAEPHNHRVSTLPQGSPQSDCGICFSCADDIRDQLVPCAMCRQTYHTKCFGGKRIPFSLKSVKERTNRDRYISKYFSDWICLTCSERKMSSAGAPLLLTSPPS
jgi:hypothetical protein